MSKKGLSLYFPSYRLRLGLWVFLALGLQLLVIYAGLGWAAPLRRVIFILSYLILFVFVAANWRRLGIAVIGVGLLLNFLAIAANGGLMPIAPETMVRAGLAHRLAGLEPGDPVPFSKDVLLEKGDTRLRFLSDILVVDNPADIRAFSVGDTVIAAGLIVTLAEVFLPRVRRSSSLPRGNVPNPPPGS